MRDCLFDGYHKLIAGRFAYNNNLPALGKLDGLIAQYSGVRLVLGETGYNYLSIGEQRILHARDALVGNKDISKLGRESPYLSIAVMFSKSHTVKCNQYGQE